MNIKPWIKAFRLRTLPLSISGIIVGSFCALQNDFWSGTVFTLALVTTVLFQVLSNLANDLGDTLKGADNKDRVGPERAVQSGAITIPQMRNAIILVSILSLASAGILIYFGTKTLSINIVYGYIILAFACVAAAILYTMGKKAYGYLGLGDIFVFIFFGLVSVIGVYPLFANGLDKLIVLPAITIGCLSTMVLNLNNMRDHKNDEAVGKRTIVVKMGYPAAKKYHFSLLLVGFAAWTIFAVISGNYYLGITILPFILLFKHIGFVFKNQNERELDGELKKVALGTFLLSLLFALSVGLKIWLA